MRLLAVLLLAVSSLVHAAEAELLEPEKAFQFSARLQDPRTIEVTYRIAPGYYLYRDKFRFSAAPSEVKLGAPQIPRGKRKRDEFFGEVETHRGDLTIIVPFEVAGAGLTGLTLTATSQGCADVGVCYVPQEQKADLMLASLAAAAPQGGAAEQLFGAQPPVSDATVATLFASGFWLVVASFFGFGLLLSFTPCVLPMVPILSGVIVGGGAHITKTR
jgi:thiol:disulfide interchange protein DsbD